MPEGPAVGGAAPGPRPLAQVVLVTGASSGIGRATSMLLAKRGHTVFAGVRAPEKVQGRLGTGVEVIPLDVTSTRSSLAAVTTILDGAGRLDAVVNNAGYGQYGSLEDVSDEDARAQFDTNVFGMAGVIRAALPTMRARGSGRIVNISSVAGKISTPFAGWYAASKHAVEALSDALRLETAPLGITVSLIEPGAVKTGFDGNALDSLQRSASEAYRARAQTFGTNVARAYAGAPGPDLVAAAVQHAVESAHPRTRYVVPRVSAGALVLARRWLSDRQLDRLLASQLGRAR